MGARTRERVIPNTYFFLFAIRSDYYQGRSALESPVIIVGSGVGGAVLAYELAHKGLNVIVLEAGTYHKLGTERRALSFYSHSDIFNPAEKSREGTQLLRTIMVARAHRLGLQTISTSKLWLKNRENGRC